MVLYWILKIWFMFYLVDVFRFMCNQINIFHLQSLNEIFYFLGQMHFLGFVVPYRKRYISHVYSPLNWLHIFRTPFPKNTYGGCFWSYLFFPKPYRNWLLNNSIAHHQSVSSKTHQHCMSAYYNFLHELKKILASKQATKQ